MGIAKMARIFSTKHALFLTVKDPMVLIVGPSGMFSLWIFRP